MDEDEEDEEDEEDDEALSKDEESDDEDEMDELVRAMLDDAEGSAEGTEARVVGLSPRQLEILSRKVYLLLRRELVIERERLGQHMFP